MLPLNVQMLAPGDRVNHELLVYERVDRVKGDGEPFVLLTLGNASGQIGTAPIWSSQMEWADGADRGKIVQVIGNISVYQKTGKRQIQLTAPLRVIPDQMVNVEDFLPRIDGDCTRLWEWVDRARNDVASPTLRRVLGLFFDDDVFRLRFEKTPGSITGHHAKIGGLLLHVFEVTSVARQTARTVRANVDLVVTGALLHDIGKVESYTISNGVFTFTPCGLLVGHVVLGVMMLERRLAALGEQVCTEGQLLDLQHMILSHHGKQEYGSPVEPMTAEAEIVHWADETSAKTTDMMDSLEDPEAFLSGGEFSDRKIWRLGRRVWRRPHSWE